MLEAQISFHELRGCRKRCQLSQLKRTMCGRPCPSLHPIAHSSQLRMVKLRQLKNPLLKVGKVGFGLGPLRGLGIYHKFPVVTTGICGNTSRFQDADPRLPLPLRTHDPKAQGGEPVRRGAMKQLFYEALGLRSSSGPDLAEACVSSSVCGHQPVITIGFLR